MASRAITGSTSGSTFSTASRSFYLYLTLLLAMLTIAPTMVVAAPDTFSPKGAFASSSTQIGVGSILRIYVYDPEPTGQDHTQISLRDVELTVGGTDVTSRADYAHETDLTRDYSLGSSAFSLTKSSFGVISYEIPSFSSFRNGQAIAAAVRMKDGAGNARTIRKTFRFNTKSGRDNKKPTGTWLGPQTNKLLRNDRTTIRMRVVDPNTGGGRRRSLLDLSSFRLTAGGRNVTADALYYHRGKTNKAYKVGPLAVSTRFLTSDTGTIVYRPNAARPLPWGAFDVVLSFKDNEGNTGIVRRAMNVKDADSPILSLPSARPSNGNAPLTVKFQPNFDVGNAVKRVQWDFDGDGKYDINEEVGSDQSFQFKDPGTYRTRLRLTDSRGRIAIGTVKVIVRNAAPEVTASVSPSNGEVPLTVRLSATATDYNGIRSYAWDFDGDGKYEYSSTSSGVTTHEYKKVGNYKPVVLVIDNLGRASKVSLTTTEVKAARKGSPGVELSATPGNGIAPVDVRFSARGSFPDGSTATKWSWDFNGDGKYDRDTDTPSTDFRYTAARTYYPKVRVTTSNRKTAIDVASVSVGATVSLSVSADTILPDTGEDVTVNTTLSGTVNIGVNIENENGRVIRQLVKSTRRKPGDYEDKWDGRDNAGKVVKDGAYYAVAKYEIDGKKIRVDLRDSTGGQQSSPRRNRLDSSFSPFAGEPLKVTFELEKAAKVTAFMGLFNVNTRLLTFYNRQPLGKGEHTIVWNGENENGKLVHPPGTDRFLFGIFEFGLSDNAVIVSNTAEVSDVSASPSIFTPGPANKSKLKFSLTKDADVELIVIDAESGAETGRRTFRNRKAGENTINWDGQVLISRTARSYVAPGRYRVGIRAVMPNGTRSIAVYTLQQIYF